MNLHDFRLLEGRDGVNVLKDANMKKETIKKECQFMVVDSGTSAVIVWGGDLGIQQVDLPFWDQPPVHCGPDRRVLPGSQCSGTKQMSRLAQDTKVHGSRFELNLKLGSHLDKYKSFDLSSFFCHIIVCFVGTRAAAVKLVQ